MYKFFDQNSNCKKVYWSINDEQSASPGYSIIINIIKFIDKILSYILFWRVKPLLGGDIYEFFDKGIFKMVLEKARNRNNDELYTDIRFVHMPIKIILDGDLSKKILSSGKVRRGKIYDRLTEFFGFGIFTSKNYNRWLHQRQNILKLFTKKNLKIMVPNLTKSMFEYLDEYIIKNNGKCDMVKILSLMGLVGFCEVVFGVDISDICTNLIDPLNRLLVYINGAAEPFLIKCDQSYKKFAKDRDYVHDWLKELIMRAKKSDKCHNLIKIEMANPKISEMELIEFVLSIVLGGHETTARLMLGIVYCLCKDTTIINKMNLETKYFCSLEKNNEIEILNRPYIKNIIKEGTRLFPPVWLLGRKTIEDLWIDDIYIKKNTEILISPLIFLRSIKTWGEKAEIFDPDRFETMTNEQKNLFIPFVVGPENCPGELFAKLESSIVISKLFYEYDILIYDDLRPFSAGTFRVSDKMPCEIKKKLSDI